MKNQLHNILRLTLVLITALVLTGCARKVLYSNLSEKEINEMVAILLSRGIEVLKVPGTVETMWSVDVNQADIAQAIDILNTYGYPRDKFQSLGEIFQKSGLVSSPSEERIRFMYALSQGIAATLSEIDGVLTARVHVVLQNNDPFSDFKSPSSASVFIKYRRGSGVEALASQIKRLVTSSIEGLNYDKVSLTFVPSDLNQGVIVPPEMLEIPVHNTHFWLILSLAIVLALILMGMGGGYWYFYTHKKSPPKETENR